MMSSACHGPSVSKGLAALCLEKKVCGLGFARETVRASLSTSHSLGFGVWALGYGFSGLGFGVWLSEIYFRRVLEGVRG